MNGKVLDEDDTPVCKTNYTRTVNERLLVTEQTRKVIP